MLKLKELRIAKAIANSGYASRREAERLILAGCVTVDGVCVTTPVFFVNCQNQIKVDGIVLNLNTMPVKVWKMYKPRGVLTTRSDPGGRKTVYDVISESSTKPCNYDIQKPIYIGRLDYNSEGLLLFTNSGEFSRKMELPQSGLCRSYRVRFLGKLDSEILKKIQNGIVIDKIQYGPINVKDIDVSKSNGWMTMSLKEGKNREIRKILEHFGIIVSRLIRISYGPYSLNDMQVGDFCETELIEI